MTKLKIKNPLRQRIPRELLGDWKKYLVVALFLILTIGFVSGMYVANESMMIAANEGVTKYKLENGHFELKSQADAELLKEISNGEKADVKAYYLDKAKTELDEKFEDEFKTEFTKNLIRNLLKNLIYPLKNRLKALYLHRGWMKIQFLLC